MVGAARAGLHQRDGPAAATSLLSGLEFRPVLTAQAWATSRGAEWATRDAAHDAWVAEQGGDTTEAEDTEWEARYRSAHPYPYADVATVADHIDHMAKVAGIDHIGIGSDFDGVGDSLPIGLKSVADYPLLVAELLRRDYSEADIRKILGENLMRVWRAVEDVAT